MVLPEEIVTDMALSFAAIKKRRGLGFVVVPAKDPAAPAWLFIDKQERLSTRFRKASKLLSEHKFRRAAAISGELRVVGRRLIFVPEGEGATNDKLKTRLRGLWAKGLIAEESGELAKMGQLLKKCEVMTPVEADTVDEDDVATYRKKELSEKELREIFGEDAEEVRNSVAGLVDMSARLDVPDLRGASVEETARVLAQVVSMPPSELGGAVPGFLKAVAGGTEHSSAPLDVGSELASSDAMLLIAAFVNAYLRAMVAWETHQEHALELRGQIGTLLGSDDVEQLDATSLASYTDLARAYREARVRSHRGEDRADRALERLTAKVGELKKHASTRTTS